MSSTGFTTLNALINDSRACHSTKQAWDATPVAEAPRPVIFATPSEVPVAATGVFLPENTRSVTASGGIKVNGVKFQTGSYLARTLVTIISDSA